MIFFRTISHIVIRHSGRGDALSTSWTLNGVASGGWRLHWVRSLSWRNGNTQRL